MNLIGMARSLACRCTHAVASAMPHNHHTARAQTAFPLNRGAPTLPGRDIGDSFRAALGPLGAHHARCAGGLPRSMKSVCSASARHATRTLGIPIQAECRQPLPGAVITTLSTQEAPRTASLCKGFCFSWDHPCHVSAWQGCTRCHHMFRPAA